MIVIEFKIGNANADIDFMSVVFDEINSRNVIVNVKTVAVIHNDRHEFTMIVVFLVWRVCVMGACAYGECIGQNGKA